MMSTVTVAENFDWVKARSECSLASVFHQLKLQITTYISQRNAMLPKDVGYIFKITGDSPDAFSAILAGIGVPNHIYQAIDFILANREIVVRNRQVELFRGTVTLNDDGQCRLKMNGKEFTLWQVRKMALEIQFFEIV